MKEPRFWNYLLFVTFFPHLIAGPILHHKEMMPQFDRIVSAGRGIYFSRFWTNLAVGVTLFIIGLWKKVVFADSCALMATDRLQGRAGGTGHRRPDGMGRRARLHAADLFRLFRLFGHGGRTCA